MKKPMNPKFAKSILLFFLFFSNAVFSQDGAPFVTNFSVTEESMSDNYSLCLDKDGVLVVANRKGLLIFDADEWKIVKTPEMPIVVSADPVTGVVLIGCRNAIGYLTKNAKGEYEFVDLGDKNAGIVSQIIFNKQTAYFLSQTAITSFDLKDFKTIGIVKSEPGRSFLVGFNLNGKFYIDIEGKGLHILKNGKSLEAVVQKFPLSGKIVCSLVNDSSTLIIGASDNKFYEYNGKTIKNIVLQDQQYLNDGTITDARRVAKDQIAVSTISAGCMVFDMKTGKTLYTINYASGLPDDEILAMNTDGDGGIWLAHYYGFTRIDAGIPVKNYSYFKGLTGKPQTVEFFNGKLFIGTGNGVYFLDNKKDYVEFTPKTKSGLAAVKSIEPVNVDKVEVQVVAENTKETVEPKRGFLSRIFRRNTESKTTSQPKEETKNKANEENSGFFSFIKSPGKSAEKVEEAKKTYRIASVRHVFNKVPGLDNKCRQLYVAGNKLIALTISGVYEITESKAIPIIKNVSANFLYFDQSESKLYICSNEGIEVAAFKNGAWGIEPFNVPLEGPIYSFAKDVFENYWIGGESKVTKIKFRSNKSVKEKQEYTFDNDFRERVIVRISDKKPIFFLTSGIYSIFNDSVQPHRWLSKYAGQDSKMYFLHNDYTWIQHKNDWVLLKATEAPDSVSPQYLNLFANLSQIYIDKSSNVWVIEDNASIYKIDQKAIGNYKTEFNSFVKRFTGISGEILDLTDMVLDSRNNSLKIIVSAPYYLKPNSNQYQIFVEGISKEWNNWTSNPEFLLLLTSGDWKVHVRARNVFGNISEEKTLSFYIKRPFYSTWWFILACVAVFVYLIYLFIKFRERALRHEKEILENKVRERTRQIEEQKEEIEAQRDDLVEKNIQITAQKEEIEAQRNKISIQNLEITDSIRYAKRLQAAVMPDDGVMKSLLNDHFVVFKPKDIVSGDFFWAKKKNGKLIVAAADCTGHGVPGAFLSMLGMSVLNEISAINNDYSAHEILNILRIKIKSSLIKEGQEDHAKDGMDISLIIVDLEKRKIQFAGANNPIFVIRNKQLMEFAPDKMPIGSFIQEKDSFTLHEFEIIKGDVIYLFSDGFRDQIGGVADKRLKTTGFKDILLQIQDFPMSQQKEKMENFFEQWKGKNEQMDDILVMGIKMS